MYIPSLLFVVIMNGNGVCLNDSFFLKEFLNYCGFSSACLVNYYDTKSIYVDGNLQLKDDVPDTVKRKINRFFCNFKMKKSNHVYNLIKDTGEFYVFDSTGGIFNRICDFKNSSVINGVGMNRIYFYESFSLCISDEEVMLLESFLRTDNFGLPYSDYEFRIISEYCMDFIMRNLKLIEDFYDSARSDIYGISSETAKVRERILFTK